MRKIHNMEVYELLIVWCCVHVVDSNRVYETYPILNNTHSNEGSVIRLGYLTGSQKPPGHHHYVSPGRTISGAITLAVREVNESPDVLPNHTLQFLVAETYGKEAESIKQTVMLTRQNISAYIGPQETCIHEAGIAAAFNLPMISYVSIHACQTDHIANFHLFNLYASGGLS